MLGGCCTKNLLLMVLVLVNVSLQYGDMVIPGIGLIMVLIGGGSDGSWLSWWSWNGGSGVIWLCDGGQCGVSDCGGKDDHGCVFGTVVR